MNGLRRLERLVDLERALNRVWNAHNPSRSRWSSLMRARLRLIRSARVMWHYSVVPQ